MNKKENGDTVAWHQLLELTHNVMRYIFGP